MLLMLLLVSSCADSTVLQSLGRTTRAIETQHRARLGNHTKQSIHSATTTNPPNNQGHLHLTLTLIAFIQQPLHSTSFPNAPKIPNPLASYLLLLLLLQVYFKTFLECDSC
ncbi:unnamed protein product [Sphagnum troendelagicum]|uniref:Uncharacterized protein n=1 Tax=Sphagnum troendelagicum TaxID=128251 RepID=A0ABP0U3Y1_9BRYO